MLLTVDSNGDDLVEGEAIRTNESGDLSNRVDLGVLLRGAARASVLKSNIKTVLLGDDQEDSGPWVLL